MDIPKYDSLPGEGTPNPDRGNHKYKVWKHTDSAGNQGEWHIYADSSIPPQFIAGIETLPEIVTPDQAQQMMAAAAGQNDTPAPPVQNNGGVEAPAPAPAPAAAAAPVDMHPILGNVPDNAWQKNSKGEWYWTEEKTDSTGLKGEWHHYVDSSKDQYVRGTVTDGIQTVPDPADATRPAGWGETPDWAKNHENQPAQAAQPAAAPASDGTPAVTPWGQTPDWAKNHENQTAQASQSTAIPVTDNTPGIAQFGETPEWAKHLEAVKSANTGTNVSDGGVLPPVEVAGGNFHVVVSGDNMWNIAQANHMSVEQLEALNPEITHPELIIPGQHINLGGGGDTSTFPTSSSYETATNFTPVANNHNDHAVGGWSDGSGNVASDPATGFTNAAGAVQTDPLKIDENKKHDG
jgi:LysM repeat protein